MAVTTLTAHFERGDGESRVGEVWLTPTQVVLDSSGDVVVTNQQIRVPVDEDSGDLGITGDGVDLVVVDSPGLNSDTWAYKVQLRYDWPDESPEPWFIQPLVADGATVDLTSLTPAVPGPVLNSYVLRSEYEELLGDLGETILPDLTGLPDGLALVTDGSEPLNMSWQEVNASGDAILIDTGGNPADDDVVSMVEIIPSDDHISAILVKRPSGDWGDAGDNEYARGQVIQLHTELDEQPGLTSRGAWDSGTAYAVYDAVTDGGTTYYAVAATTNEDPSSTPAKWVPVITPYETVSDEGAWDSGTAYSQWDLVSHNGQRYYAARASTGQTPALLSSYWSSVSPGNLIYRVDGVGGIGTTGLHVTPGTHNPTFADLVADPPFAAVWIEPKIDTTGVLLFSPPKYGSVTDPATNYLACVNVRTNPSTTPFKIDYFGRLVSSVDGNAFGTTPITGFTVAVQPTSALGNGGLALRQQASGTGGLMAWYSNANVEWGRIGLAGHLGVGVPGSSFGTVAGVAGFSLGVIPTTTANGGLMLQGLASQSGALMACYNSAATELLRIAATGFLGVTVAGSSFGSPSGVTGFSLGVIPTTTANGGLMLKGLASQSGGLMAWYNSADTELGRIAATGFLGITVAGSSFGSPSGVSGWSLGVLPTIAANGGLLVKGLASQVGALQGWYSSADVLLSQINKDGYFITRKNAAPADGDLAANDLAIWFDSTNGAAKAKFKGKSANGTVVAGEVALA